MFTKLLYTPIGACLVLVRLGMLLVLIFLRLILAYLQGTQSQITSQLTRFYLIFCGVFIAAEGDVSKELFFPVNGASGCDEFILALTHSIKSVLSPQSWKFSTILLRICNISLGGRGLQGQPRFVFTDSRELKNLPQQQSVQPISLAITNMSPFASTREEGFVLSILRILAAPISIFELRFLRPIKLADISAETDSIPEVIKGAISRSLAAPTRDQLFRIPVAVREPNFTQQRAGMSPMFLQRVNSVMEVFPQVDRQAVITDLRATNDLDATIQNILLGKIPNAPEASPNIAGSSSSRSLSNASGGSSHQFATDLVDESLADGSNPIKSWMSLQQRKSALLQFARAKYLAKHSP